MNVARHIAKLNRLLEAELGPNPLYRWIHSDSADFRRAMRVIDIDGNPQWDYRCPCGLNVQVHSPECIAGELIVAEPRYEIRKTDKTLNDQWVLCTLIPPPPEAEWRKMFGTRLVYPRNGTWAPVETETRIVAMAPDTLPGENFTMALIRARQRSREVSGADLKNGWERRKEKEASKRKEEARQRILECFPFAAKPDVVSFGGVGSSPHLRPKQGESLVTL